MTIKWEDLFGLMIESCTSQIKEVKEMSLTANQEKSKMKRKDWTVEGELGKVRGVPLRGGPLNDATLVIELRPMEIRTFLLKF